MQNEQEIKEIIADNLYNINDHRGHPLMDSLKCDEISEIIIKEIDTVLQKNPVSSTTIDKTEQEIKDKFFKNHCVHYNETGSQKMFFKVWSSPADVFAFFKREFGKAIVPLKVKISEQKYTIQELVNLISAMKMEENKNELH